MPDTSEARPSAVVQIAQRSGFTRREARSLPLAVGGLLLLVVINVLIYVIPINYRALGMLAYPGVFLITFIANATTFVPVPYIPIVAHVARTVDLVWLVVLLGALGSVFGESVAFAVGRAEQHVIQDHRWYQRLHAVLARPVRAGIFLFFFAVPLNPLFDVAGLAAGALGVPYRVFFLSVLAGRVVRFGLIAWLGIKLGFGS